ncbi:MAG: PIN domain-containing protein [Candidatus Latescibacterota bacterium]
MFDTNLLVLYFKGNPARAILEAAFTGLPGTRLSFSYSEEMLQEYRDVLTGLTAEDPATFAPAHVAETLSSVRRRGRLIHPDLTLDLCSHEPDNRFLECAVTAQADYLVTVNLRHFPES